MKTNVHGSTKAAEQISKHRIAFHESPDTEVHKELCASNMAMRSHGKDVTSRIEGRTRDVRSRKDATTFLHRLISNELPLNIFGYNHYASRQHYVLPRHEQIKQSHPMAFIVA